jgi:two-component sensor histidine kinase
VLHELATNAAKYGSLSRPIGTVNLRWTVDRRDGQRILTMTWRERGGPPALPPTASWGPEHQASARLTEADGPNANLPLRSPAAG